jgi:hypothetical protein
MKKVIEQMADIVINGILKKGTSLKIVNNKVLLDGVDITPVYDKAINIEVFGDINEMNIGSCNIINVKGDIGNLETTTGDVIISGDVRKSVSSISGAITCSGVNGHIQTSTGNVVITNDLCEN